MLSLNITEHIQMRINDDRRSESRKRAKKCYGAEIRLDGVPVYEVKLKDLSPKGACIIFQNNPSLLNHLQIGQELRVKYFLEDRSKPSETFLAKVKHITEVEVDRFNRYYLAGLSIL